MTITLSSYQDARNAASDTIDPSTGLKIPVTSTGGGQWRSRTEIAADIARCRREPVTITGDWRPPQ